MSDVIDIGELRKSLVEKTEKKDLTEFATKQQEVIEQMAFKIKELVEKNTHLENLLMSISNGGDVKAISPEELICLEQIQILKSKSSERELSLDETKRLDLFIKNLKLIRSEVTQVIDSPNLEGLTASELIAIATAE